MPISSPEPLNATHDLSAFASGKLTLDHWLKTRALANLPSKADPLILCLSMADIAASLAAADFAGPT